MNLQKLSPDERNLHYTNICNHVRALLDAGVIPLACVCIGPGVEQAGISNFPNVDAANAVGVLQMIALEIESGVPLNWEPVVGEPQKPSMN